MNVSMFNIKKTDLGRKCQNRSILTFLASSLKPWLVGSTPYHKKINLIIFIILKVDMLKDPKSDISAKNVFLCFEEIFARATINCQPTKVFLKTHLC